MCLRVAVLMLAAVSAAAVEIPPASAAIRSELEKAAQAIEQKLAADEDLAPMRVLWTARGTYLTGYGAVLTLELNIAPTSALSPFRPAYSEEELRRLNLRKRQRLEVLEDRLRQVLVEEGSRLSKVPLEEHVAVVVTLFHFSWEDKTELPSQIVLQARRSALQEIRGAGAETVRTSQILKPRFY